MRRRYGKDPCATLSVTGASLAVKTEAAVSVAGSSGRPFVLAVPTDEALLPVSHKIVAQPMTRFSHGALWSKSRARLTWPTTMQIMMTAVCASRYRLRHLIRPTTSSIRHERPLAGDQFCGVNYQFGSLIDSRLIELAVRKPSSNRSAPHCCCSVCEISPEGPVVLIGHMRRTRQTSLSPS
jgi:hypothetical protein